MRVVWPVFVCVCTTYRDAGKSGGLWAGRLDVADAVLCGAVHIQSPRAVGGRESAAVCRRGGRAVRLGVVVHH